MISQRICGGKWEQSSSLLFLTMLHVTPEYIAVFSNPAEIIVDEDESEIILPLRGYICCKANKSRVVATILLTEGIRVDKANRLDSGRSGKCAG